MSSINVPRLAIIIAIPVALLLMLPGLVIDLWWFREVGYEVVFTRSLFTRLILFVAVSGVAGTVLAANLAFAQRGALPEPVLVRFGDMPSPVDLSGVLKRFSLPVTIGLRLVRLHFACALRSRRRRAQRADADARPDDPVVLLAR